MTHFGNLRRNHDFTVLWVGQTTSALGSTVSLFAFPLLGYAITGSTFVAALAEAMHLLGMAATLLPAGLLADRMNRGLLMRLSSGTGVLLYASLVVAGVLDAVTVPHLLAVALLTGAGVGLFAPAEMAAVRAVVPTPDLPAALSQNQARQHVASLVGGPLGGALYAVTRWLPFLADAVSYAVSFLLLGRIRADLAPVAKTGPRRRARQEILEGLRFTWSKPFFRVLLCWGACTNLVVNALFMAAILRLIQTGFAPWSIGLVETTAGAFGLLGAVVAPTLIDRFPTGRLTVVVAWSFVPLLVPLVLWNHPAVVAAALAAGLFLNPTGNAGIGSYRIAMTPPDLIGRVQSTSQFVTMSAMPLAPVLAGGLLGLLGGPRTMAVLAVLVAVVALIPTLSRTVRSVPRPAVWNAASTLAAEREPAAEEGPTARHTLDSPVAVSTTD